MLALVENVRRKQLDWVSAILNYRGWKPSRLANEAGINHSTLSKWMNDPLNVAQLNSMTVEKLADAGGIPPYHTSPVNQPRGFAETEAAPFLLLDDDPVAAAVGAIIGGRNGVDAWTMKSRALESAGFLPGDVLIVDLNAGPEPGDAVCAQLYDRAGRADTVFRIYEYPYLVAASYDPGLRRPVLIDNDHAKVMGVVIATVRPRLARH
jgi:hypothetical protein